MDGVTNLAEAKSLTDLASAALQYGPFFFAITFVFLIPVVGHHWFMGLLTLHDDKIGAEERRVAIRVFRLYWVSGIVMGLALVMFASMWWIFVQTVYVLPSENDKFIDDQMNRRLYSFQIKNIAQSDFISADSDPANNYQVYADHNPYEPVHAVVIFNRPPLSPPQVSLDYRDAETTTSIMSGGSGVPWTLTFPAGTCRQFLLVRSSTGPTLKPNC